MRFNTVTKKSVLVVSIIGLVVLLAINMLFPTIFYSVMEPHLIKQVKSVVSSNALRLSYIWRNNLILHQIRLSEALKDLVVRYYGDGDGGEREDIKEELLTFLPTIKSGRVTTGILSGQSDIASNYGYIVSTHHIMMFTSEGDFFYNGEAEKAARVLAGSDWYKSFDMTVFDNENEFFEYIPVIEDKDDPGFRIACKVDSFQAGGVTCFGVDAVDFEEILAQFDEFSEFGIDDYKIICNDKTIYSNLGERSRINIEEYPAYMSQGGQYEPMVWTEGDQVNIEALCTYVRENYRVALNIPKSTLLAPYEDAFQYFQLFLGAIALILIVAFCVTLKGMLNRLVRLDREMDRIRSGDYNVTLSDKSGDELGSLANTFNMMLQKIKEDMKNEERMQYSLMVSAIDPHYIYNTLNTITALAELSRNEDVVTVNKALIATLKDRLKMKNYKTFDTVRAEREALEQYMCIQRFLCHYEIFYTFSVPDEDLDMQIPKNIIQPLVENSIKHGILCNEDEAGEPKRGVIEVFVWRRDSQICIEISDNGAGIARDTLDRFFGSAREESAGYENDMEHIGVYNVRMRLKYLYQEAFQFLVESVIGQGTTVRITIPTGGNGKMDTDGGTG